MSRRPKRSFRIQMRHGILCGRCTECGQWKSLEEGFHVNSNLSIGRNSRCKACFADLHQRRKAEDPDGVKSRRQAAYRKQRELQLQADRVEKLERERKRQFVPMSEYRPHLLRWIDRLVEMHETVEQAGQACGVSGRRLQEIRNDPREYIELPTVDRIATAADAMLELHELEPEPGVDNWSPKHGTRFCSDCGTWRHPHQAKGLCARCYSFYRRGKSREDYLTIWAKKAGHACCVDCGTKERKHVARGLCKRCYHKHEMRSRRQKDHSPSLALATSRG